MQTRSGTRAHRGGCSLGTQGSNGMMGIQFPSPRALKMARWFSAGPLPSGALSAAWARTLRVWPRGPPRHSITCPATVTGRNPLTVWAEVTCSSPETGTQGQRGGGQFPHTVGPQTNKGLPHDGVGDSAN